MNPRTPTTFLWTAALLALALVVFAACAGGGKKTPTTGTPTARATSPATKVSGTKIDTSQVPELQDGKITVGSDIAYAPIEYYEEGTQNEKGMDIDLMKAIAQALGVNIEFKQVAEFAGIVGDLQAKRYDIVVSAISISPAREAQIDFIKYFGPVGTGVLVPKGNPKGISTIQDICGLKVAAQVGTVQVDQMNALNEADCKDNPITISTLPDNPTAVQELTLGRIDAELADDPVAAYSASQSNGKLEAIATGYESAPYGIGVRKDSPELKAALQQALQQIIANGTYVQILRTWGQEAFGIQ